MAAKQVNPMTSAVSKLLRIELGSIISFPQRTVDPFPTETDS